MRLLVPEMTENPRTAADFRIVNKRVIQEFRAAAGNVGGPLEERDVLLLTTTGALYASPTVDLPIHAG